MQADGFDSTAKLFVKNRGKKILRLSRGFGNFAGWVGWAKRRKNSSACGGGYGSHLCGDISPPDSSTSPRIVL